MQVHIETLHKKQKNNVLMHRKATLRLRLDGRIIPYVFWVAFFPKPKIYQPSYSAPPNGQDLPLASIHLRTLVRATHADPMVLTMKPARKSAKNTLSCGRHAPAVGNRTAGSSLISRLANCARSRFVVVEPGNCSPEMICMKSQASSCVAKRRKA